MIYKQKVSSPARRIENVYDTGIKLFPQPAHHSESEGLEINIFVKLFSFKSFQTILNLTDIQLLNFSFPFFSLDLHYESVDV